MKKYLLFSKVVPRWLIMLVDLSIVAWSFSTSYFIVERFEFINILRGYFFIYTGLYSALAAIVMYAMRIHIGLIRYSNTRDMLRIFGSAFIASLLYMVIINASSPKLFRPYPPLTNTFMLSCYYMVLHMVIKWFPVSLLLL